VLRQSSLSLIPDLVVGASWSKGQHPDPDGHRQRITAITRGRAKPGGGGRGGGGGCRCRDALGGDGEMGAISLIGLRFAAAPVVDACDGRPGPMSRRPLIAGIFTRTWRQPVRDGPARLVVLAAVALERALLLDWRFRCTGRRGRPVLRDGRAITFRPLLGIAQVGFRAPAGSTTSRG